MKHLPLRIVPCEPLTAEKFKELVEKAKRQWENFSWKEFDKTLPTIEQTNPGLLERIRKAVKESRRYPRDGK